MPLYRMLQRPCPTCRGRARVDAPGRVVERAAIACRAWLSNQPGLRARVRLSPDLIPALRLELEDLLERIDLKGDRELPAHLFKVEEA